MAEEVPADQIDEFGCTFLANDETRSVLEKKQRSGRTLFKRVDLEGDNASLFARCGRRTGILIGEMQALEGVGRSWWNFLDHDELSWQSRLDMARQCWDGTRHTETYAVLVDTSTVGSGSSPRPSCCRVRLLRRSRRARGGV